MPHPNWTLLRSEPVSDHRIFKIRHDIYRFEPRQAERDFVVVECADWVNVVPITDDGQVVMVKQYRHGLLDVALELPGGVIDPGEEPQHAAVRELREETGYGGEKWSFLGRVHANPSIQGNWSYSYLVEGCRLAGPTHLDPFEDIEVVLYPLSAIPEMIRREEITNTMVINAFAFLGLLHRE